jgi:3-deoxy-D-arabino-heptulosonate 7-phosphate (DAHP) synthase class II
MCQLNIPDASYQTNFSPVDLRHPLDWSLSHVRAPALQASFERIVENLIDALDFIKVVGGEDNHGSGVVEGVKLWTSHEVRHLNILESFSDSDLSKGSLARIRGKSDATFLVHESTPNQTELPSVSKTLHKSNKI